MRMPAKFPGKCAGCGKPIAKGAEIDYEDRQAYHAPLGGHPGCYQPSLGADDGDPGGRLPDGWRQYTWEELVGANEAGLADCGQMQLLSGSDRGDATGRDSAAPCANKDSLRGVPETHEGIVGVGG